MSDFSIREAALEGFRLARERPVAVAIWAGVQLAFSVAIIALMFGLAGEALAGLQASRANPEAPPDMSQLGALMGAYGLMLPLSLVYYAVMLSAASRAVLQPEDDRMGFLRFGADELRMLVVMLVISVVMIVAVFVGAILLGIVAAIVGMATRGEGVLPIVIVLYIPFLLGLLWVWSRFSLAPPMTLARGSIEIFGSWALTKGRSGKVFLTLLLSGLLYALVMLLGFCIWAGPAALMGGGVEAVTQVMQPTASSIGGYFNPATIAYTVVMAVFGAMGTAILLCPPAVIYKHIAGEAAQEVF